MHIAGSFDLHETKASIIATFDTKELRAEDVVNIPEFIQLGNEKARI